jgi:hypothetical protein
MSVSRTPHNYFPSPDRVLPKIATLRYSNVADLRKEYQCPHKVILKVLDNGELFDFHTRGSSFIGVVFDNGRSIALNQNPYFLFENSDKVANKIEFLRQCVNKGGKSLFQDFQISTLPSRRVDEKRLPARQKAILANLEPNISSQRTR